MNNKRKPLNERDEQVLEYLKSFNVGEGPTKEMLQMMLFKEMNKNFERMVRFSIQKLRDHGYVIASSSDKPGYRLTTNKDDVKHYVNETRKRAKMLLATARKVERAHGLRNNMRMSLTS